MAQYNCPVCPSQSSSMGEPCVSCKEALAAIEGLSPEAKGKMRHIAKDHPELLGGMSTIAESIFAQVYKSGYGHNKPEMKISRERELWDRMPKKWD